jgi:hypothetical protein
VLLELRAGAAGSNGWSEAFAFALDVSTPANGSEPDDEPGEKPDVVSIESIVTEPEHDRLVVTFSDDVVCPDTANGRAAWDFRNLSVVESGDSQAGGVPESVTQVTSPGVSCHLNYESEGVENGDYGTMDYTKPSDETGQVHDRAAVVLESQHSVVVRDGVAPEFLAVRADNGQNPDVLELEFSEPVACVSLHSDNLAVFLGFQSTPATIQGFDCDGAEANPKVHLVDGSRAAGELAVVSVVGPVVSESQYHEVAHVTQIFTGS